MEEPTATTTLQLSLSLNSSNSSPPGIGKGDRISNSFLDLEECLLLIHLQLPLSQLLLVYKRALVVMYDATGVRLNAGRQAEV
ncbi:hypothetical protein HID58_034720 [Brassica napus]|uniref:Uncharacterized protein n=2 Tax=Brassica TaxID=3705 RepID=A0A8D9CY55_BRACM|nr:hypothetical protein HID58_034720 [Brassica napus]CAF2045296.1 unnamed protein product [Brassica napus]CAG7864564.1 unnamed protein product [Brassica rapa]